MGSQSYLPACRDRYTRTYVTLSKINGPRLRAHRHQGWSPAAGGTAAPVAGAKHGTSVWVYVDTTSTSKNALPLDWPSSASRPSTGPKAANAPKQRENATGGHGPEGHT